jgi:hypothetical protein
MKSSTYSNLIEKRCVKTEMSEQNTEIKKIYLKLLELLARKTDSEKRIQLFGKDPFK